MEGRPQRTFLFPVRRLGAKAAPQGLGVASL